MARKGFLVSAEIRARSSTHGDAPVTLTVRLGSGLVAVTPSARCRPMPAPPKMWTETVSPGTETFQDLPHSPPPLHIPSRPNDRRRGGVLGRMCFQQRSPRRRVDVRGHVVESTVVREDRVDVEVRIEPSHSTGTGPGVRGDLAEPCRSGRRSRRTARTKRRWLPGRLIRSQPRGHDSGACSLRRRSGSPAAYWSRVPAKVNQRWLRRGPLLCRMR